MNKALLAHFNCPYREGPMADSLSCPSCGAPISSPGSGTSTNCIYCGALVEVPAAFRALPATGLTGEKVREIADYIRAGQKIQAIKTLRLVEPQGLAQSKDSVERAEKLLKQSPQASEAEIYTALSGGSQAAVVGRIIHTMKGPGDYETRQNQNTIVFTVLVIFLMAIGISVLVFMVIR
jgi:hypothetical protein